MELNRNSRRLSGLSVENLSLKIIKGLSGASKRSRSASFRTPDVSIIMHCFAGASLPASQASRPIIRQSRRKAAAPRRATDHVGQCVIDLRIASMPSSHGERIVVLLLDKSARLYRLPAVSKGILAWTVRATFDMGETAALIREAAKGLSDAKPSTVNASLTSSRTPKSRMS